MEALGAGWVQLCQPEYFQKALPEWESLDRCLVHIWGTHPTFKGRIRSNFDGKVIKTFHWVSTTTLSLKILSKDITLCSWRWTYWLLGPWWFWLSQQDCEFSQRRRGERTWPCTVAWRLQERPQELELIKRQADTSPINCYCGFRHTLKYRVSLSCLPDTSWSHLRRKAQHNRAWIRVACGHVCLSWLLIEAGGPRSPGPVIFDCTRKQAKCQLLPT